MSITRRSFGTVALTAAAAGPPSAIASEHSDAAEATALNRVIVRRYFEEVWNQGRLDVLDELLDPDYINHTPSTPNPPLGPAGLKPIVAEFRTAFPDLLFRIEDLFATPNRAVARVVMTGTHRGSLFGIPPTGRSVEVNQINIEQIARGRIVEHWRVTDELALMRQLGR
jgi:steroid delta-isomerase-like uncharacterized protein